MDNLTDHTWKLLIVDDDEDDYLLVHTMLADVQQGNCSLEWAGTYETGKTALEKDHYDAVLMDYDLGLHNGLELIREMNARDYPGAFILYTGRGSREVDMEAMQAGASMYLTKGETSSLMLERGIRYAIDRKRYERVLADQQARLEEANIALEEANAALQDQAAELEIQTEELRAQTEELIETNEKLRASEGKFMAIFQHSPFAVALSTLAEGRLVDVNEAWLALYGYKKEEVIGKTSKELDIFQQRSARDSLRAELEKNGFVRNYELEYRAKSGKVFVLSSNMDVITIGETRYLLAASQDVTERKRAEKALRENQRRS